MSDLDLIQQLRQLLPLDPNDGTIVVGFSKDGWPRWGSPNGLVDALVALIAAAEARGYQRAIDALRYADRFLKFSETHPLVEHVNPFGANDMAADFLEASAQTATPDAEPAPGGQQQRGSRFRKKPVVIEAMQLTEDADWEAIAEWCGGRLVNREEPGTGEQNTSLIIHTLEGDMTAVDDDWIIRGVKGEFYPCKPDIFEATYEPAPGVPVDTEATP